MKSFTFKQIKDSIKELGTLEIGILLKALYQELDERGKLLENKRI